MNLTSVDHNSNVWRYCDQLWSAHRNTSLLSQSCVIPGTSANYSLYMTSVQGIFSYITTSDICPRHFLIYYNVRRPSIPFGSSQGWVTMEIRPIPCKQYLPALFCYKFTDTGSVKCCKGIFIRWTVDCVAYEISFFCIVVGVTIFTCIL